MINKHFTDREIRMAEFFVRNRTLIKRTVIMVLFVLNLGLIYNLGIKWVYYGLNDLKTYNAERELTSKTYIPIDKIRKKFSPIDLQIRSVYAVPVPGARKIDVFAVVYNPNIKWKINELKYRFVVDGRYLDEQTAISVLPRSYKYLIKFNIDYNSLSPSIRLDLVDVKWERVGDIQPLRILDNIKIKDIDVRRVGSDGLFVSGVVDNMTPYGFWNMGVYVVLYDFDENIIGINYISLDRVNYSSQKEFSAFWAPFYTTPYRVDAVIDLDVYDKNNYIDLDFEDYAQDALGRE